MKLLDKTGLYVLPLCLGLLFFAASLTPTLIPRDWLVQGALGGLVMALGYLIGRAAITLYRLMDLREPAGKTAHALRLALLLPALLVAALCLAQTRDWQNGIRARMGMELAERTHTLQLILVAIAVFALLVLVGYALQWLFRRVKRWLLRFMPERTANVAGFLLTGLIVLIITRDGVLDRVIGALDSSFTVAQNLFETAPPVPEGVATGGAGSLVDWGAMGRFGRDYVSSGPTKAEIEAFTGRPALAPVRVYVGRAQAASPEERAETALAELIRQGGFERSVLVIAMPPGTGWLDPGSTQPLEIMHGGDVALVSVQYSYLMSPLALILETRAGLDQAKALISAVHGHWRSLPKDSRPRLYIHGLSLGAWSSMYGTDLFALLDDPINGAFWTGPPFPSAMWQSITAARNEDSPYAAPELGDGALVRFASHYKEAGGAEGWGDMRIVYLQYSSDPIVFFENASLWRAPAWMREPPAPDVSPDMRFMPVVTQFQLAVDMALANTAPPGHGHAYYGADYVGPWVAVTDPPNWSEGDTARLKAYCDTGFDKGCGDE